MFERAIPLSEPPPPRDLTALADPDCGGRKRRGKPHAVSAEFRASGGWNICFVRWRRRAARGRPDAQMWTRGRHEPEMEGSADIRLCRRRQRPAEHQRPLRRSFDQRQTYVEAGRCRDDGRGSGGYRQGSRQAAATRRSRGMYREGSPPRVKAGRWGRFLNGRDACLQTLQPLPEGVEAVAWLRISAFSRISRAARTHSWTSNSRYKGASRALAARWSSSLRLRSACCKSDAIG